VAGHPDLPRRRKHVSHNMARYFHVSAGNHQIAFDRAGDADLPACDVQVAVNDLVLHDRDAVALAEFRGGSRRRREQRRAQTRKRSEEHTSELQSLAYLVCRLLLEKKKEEERHLVVEAGTGVGKSLAYLV